MEFLGQEWQRGIHDQASIALLMIDVDFFKHFNDTRGQQAGDDCLRRVADVISGRIKRASDLSARHGGEEFAVILSGAEQEGALSVAHWIRGEVERQQIPHGMSAVSNYVTVSIGVAVTAPVGGVPPESLILAADAALSRAKELGRNAVIAVAAAAAI